MDMQTGSPAVSAAAGSVSSQSLSGFVLSFPPAFSPPSRSTAAAVTTSLRSLDLKPNESDLRLLMEDARTQFGNLTMKRWMPLEQSKLRGWLINFVHTTSTGYQLIYTYRAQ
jgi:hypothetical protein